MTALLEFKQRIKGLYGKYEVYLLPLMKFVLALVYFIWINMNMGYMKALDNIFVVLILSLICSILPAGMMIFAGFAMMVGHCYALGIDVAAFMLVLILFVFFYNKIFAITFDETFAQATGVKADLYNTLIAVLTAVTIVLGMRMMGALLISSLIIFPALTSMRVCRTFKSVVINSAVIAVVCLVIGISVSYVWATPAGASVVMANIAALLIYTLIVWASVLFSAFIDNIPYVATMLPVVQGIAAAMGVDPTVLYFGLLSGATLGGNMTPIGASANITGIGILRKNGYEVKNSDFFRIGIPFTLAAVIPAYIYIWVVYGM